MSSALLSRTWIRLAGFALLFASLCVREANADERAKIVWRTPLKEVGQSSVCVHGDNVYITIHGALSEGNGKTREIMVASDVFGQCFDRNSGKLKWEVPIAGSRSDRVLESWHDATSLTPVADAERVIFNNLLGRLMCCDHSGKQLWERAYDVPDVGGVCGEMILRGGTLIVGLPKESGKEGGKKGKKGKHGSPFYQLHGIDVATGKDLWVSPVPQSHISGYSLQTREGQPTIVTAIGDLSHYNYGFGSKGYFVSPTDGKTQLTFKLDGFSPHQKCQLCRGLYVSTVSSDARTIFQLIDPKTSKVEIEFAFEQPDVNYAWNGERYVVEPWKMQFANTSKYLKHRMYPTPSTMHVVGNRIFYFASMSPSIGCVDTTTGKSVMLAVPVQVLAKGAVWDIRKIEFTKGIENSAGQVVYHRPGNDDVRGPRWGGFGHVKPSWPIQTDKYLYWQGGIGVLYRIDLEGEFSPDKISWTSIDDVGKHWTFGSPAITEDGIYVRSQLELVKLQW